MCAECFCEQVCEWSAQWHSYIIVLGSILLQVPETEPEMWIFVQVSYKESPQQGKERGEKERSRIQQGKEKGDSYGLHTSFNLISTEPLDHELYPEGFYLFLYNHFFYGLQEGGSRESFSLSE